MIFTQSVFSGDFDIQARDVSLRGARWLARPKPTSSFTRVDLSSARLEPGAGALSPAHGFPMANVLARDLTACSDCVIRLVDGSDAIDLSGALIESGLEVTAPSLRDLILQRARGAALSGETDVAPGALRMVFLEPGAIFLDRLDLSNASAHLNLLELGGGLECRSCRFDAATFPGPLGSFKDVEADQSDFSGATFTGVTSENSRLTGVAFTRARFESSRFQATTFTQARFDGATFKDGFISDVTFEGARFNGPAGPADIKQIAGVASKLSSARFINSDLSGLTFDHWRLQSVELSAVNFANADLTSARMELMTMDDVRFDGAILNNATLSGALSGLRLSGAKVGRLNVTGELSGSSLVGVVPSDTGERIFMLPRVMSGVDLRRADLSETILEPGQGPANLQDLDLDGARVSCSWKRDIVAAGPNGARGAFSYAAYSMGTAGHLEDGTCAAIMVQPVG